MDIIFLRDFRIDVFLGVYSWEKPLPQRVSIDLDIALPGQRAATSDDLGDTIDYGAVLGRLRETLPGRHFALLESLAEHIAGVVRGEFGAPWVRVTVTKLGMLRDLERVGLTIERGHAD